MTSAAEQLRVWAGPVIPALRGAHSFFGAAVCVSLAIASGREIVAGQT
jgi:hypothetical protein